MNEGWREGRVVPVEGPFLVANTSAPHAPRMAWGGADDAFMVMSDAPEVLDGSNLGAGPGTLYSDVSGAIRGRCRAMLFHINRTGMPLRMGVSVRNMGARGGSLERPARLPLTSDANGTRGGVTVLGAYFASLQARPARAPVGAGAVAGVAEQLVPPGETLVGLVPFALRDDAGAPLPMAVQTWAAAAAGGGARPDDLWQAPLVPWQTASNKSAKIRATIPHAEAQVIIDAPGDRPVFLDLCAVAPSGGAGGTPGDGDPGPVGFPRRGATAGWLAPSHGQAQTDAPWPYQADPAGFDGTAPAGEYVAGWNDADQRAEGVADPSASPAFWYRSSRYGVWMRQWNYGEYGFSLDVTIRSEAALALAVTPARERFACPWVWRDPARGRVGGVPWQTITAGLLGTHYGGASTGYVVAAGPREHHFVTSVTPGAYAPYRIAIVPVRR